MLGPNDFLGVWRLSRQIDDRFGGTAGTFVGTARFAQVGPQQLDYAEEGQIRFGDGPTLTANRHYQWHFRSDMVDVRFADGAAFHGFVPQGQVDGTDHPCGDDHYQVAYDFTDWPRWRATWRVTGPRKDYTSVSVYDR